MDVLKIAMSAGMLLVALHVFCDNCFGLAAVFRDHSHKPGLRRRRLAGRAVLALAALAVAAASLQSLVPSAWGLGVRNVLLLDVLALALMASVWRHVQRRAVNN